MRTRDRQGAKMSSKQQQQQQNSGAKENEKMPADKPNTTITCQPFKNICTDNMKSLRAATSTNAHIHSTVHTYYSQHNYILCVRNTNVLLLFWFFRK